MAVEQPQAFGEAVSLFEGRVRAVVSDEEGVIQVQMHVVRTWKGAHVEDIEVSTRENSAACGYAFEQDQSYLVYTYRPDDTDAQWVSLCSRTAPIDSEQAKSDIVAMGEGITPANPVSAEEEILPDEETGEDVEPARPARGGCASCSVGAPDGDGERGALGLGLALLIFASVRRGRR